ncbi:MAG: alpha/beta hydrolase [Flavobacteriaceae bacterium]
MSNFVTYKNAKIHYSDEGKGKTVVLLHGFLENISMWNNLKPHLAKTHRVISIDLLGHGQSDNIGYIHTMEVMADAVNRVLKHLKINSAVVVGHSMGGYVSLALLEANPKLVKGICLMNSTAIADSSEKKTNRERAIVAVKENQKTFVSVSISNLFRPKSRIIYKDDYKKVKREALETSVQSIVASLEGMKIRKDRLTLFRQIAIPKMVILGKKDSILDYKLQMSYYSNSDINVVSFPDGHMSHIENIEDFTYNIMHFIEYF